MFDRDFQLKKEADYSMKAEVVSESAELYVLDKNVKILKWMQCVMKILFHLIIDIPE